MVLKCAQRHVSTVELCSGSVQNVDIYEQEEGGRRSGCDVVLLLSRMMRAKILIINYYREMKYLESFTRTCGGVLCSIWEGERVFFRSAGLICCFFKLLLY